jgi:retron-type reverse transcriptase
MIKCRNTLWLIDEIISSRKDKRIVVYFKADDLFTPYMRERAIPIGNLTSQFFANVYLNGFDHFVKEHLRCRWYIRYVDDFVVFGNSKTQLHEIKSAMSEYLESLRLRLHQNKSRVYCVKDGVRFLGYRIFATHRLVDKRNVLHMKRKLKKYSLLYREGQISLDEIKQSIQSWIGHVSHADSHRMRLRVLQSVVFQRDNAESAPWRFLEQQSG